MINWVKETNAVYTADINGMEFTIHNWLGCGKEFYLSCKDLHIRTLSLNTEDIEKAKETAEQLIKARLISLISRFQEVYDILNK